MNDLVNVFIHEKDMTAVDSLVFTLWGWSRCPESDFIMKALEQDSVTKGRESLLPPRFVLSPHADKSQGHECRLPLGFVVAMYCAECAFTLKRPEVWRTFPERFSLAGHAWGLYQFTDFHSNPLRQKDVGVYLKKRSLAAALPLLGPTARTGICLVAGELCQALGGIFSVRVAPATVEQLFASPPVP